jgi:hypothetical protein
VTNFLAEYQTRDDDEILRLAADRESLVEEARFALDSELLRRGLKIADIKQHQSDVEQAEIRQEAGNLPFLFHYGTGKRLFGKRNYIADPQGKLEEFDAMLWIVIFWVPVIPLATYRVRRAKKLRLLGPWSFGKFTVLSRGGRDWRLMLSTWAWLGLTIALIVAIVNLLARY